MRKKLLQTFTLSVTFGMMGCASEDPIPGDIDGGTTSMNPAGNGGSGGSAANGGTSNTGKGGTAAGGSGNAGTSAGGVQAIGGSGTGNTGTSGATAGNGPGGSSNTVGGGASGAASGATSGGASGGGKSDTGGTASGAGRGGGRGGAAAGGAATMGGAGRGGAAAGGSAPMGGAASTCTEAQRTITSNGIGQHCGLTYEYWKDAGTGSLVLTADGFNVDWNNINNLLGRKGIRPGSANLAVTYEADYQPNGNSYLCVYGWTRGPLIEYYIVDSWGTWRPPGATAMGTVQSDGGTYDIYRTQRVQQPSIDGTQTFYQYWSVRTAKRTSGTVTVSNHVNAWANLGMNMGSFYEVSMTVEGYQSSGAASVKVLSIR